MMRSVEGMEGARTNRKQLYGARNCTHLLPLVRPIKIHRTNRQPLRHSRERELLGYESSQNRIKHKRSSPVRVFLKTQRASILGSLPPMCHPSVKTDLKNIEIWL